MDSCEAVAEKKAIIVAGEVYDRLPEDLFIPPDALEVLLESFSGPLDLLLYLIRKQNLDILDIPIESIVEQYLQYIQLMKKRRLELAAEYLLMAAMLAEIKSRMLLPRVDTESAEEEDDPRMELVRRLQAYEQIKSAAETLDTLQRDERDTFRVSLEPEACEVPKTYPSVSLADLMAAIGSILLRETQFQTHQIQREPLSVRERMGTVLQQLEAGKELSLQDLYKPAEGRGGLVVSLLAILELARQSLIVLIQANPFSPIYLHLAQHG